MRKAFLKSQRERLIGMREQVLADIANDAAVTREGQKDEGMDAYDLASEERDRDINMILSDRDRQKLLSIDESLERLRQGSYGICEECELDISEDRLKALPFTRLCVSCQADQEKEAKQVRRSEEDRGYRRFSVGESDEEAARRAGCSPNAIRFFVPRANRHRLDTLVERHRHFAEADSSLKENGPAGGRRVLETLLLTLLA